MYESVVLRERERETEKGQASIRRACALCAQMLPLPTDVGMYACLYIYVCVSVLLCRVIFAFASFTVRVFRLFASP